MSFRVVVFTFLACVGANARAEEIRTTPLVLKDGGTPEQPAVFDGKGLVIDLAIDVTDHDWRREGDLWTSRRPHFGRSPIAPGQVAGLFIEETPLSIPRKAEFEAGDSAERTYRYIAPDQLKPGQMGYLDDGTLYFRWPAAKTPGQARVLLPPKPGTSCVSIACSHIIVKNVTAKHAANDGFNIHGKRVGVRLENVKAFSNADEGISAHDDVEMAVAGAEVAWNGSAAGGVADVNRCTTSYHNCLVHDNLGAAFYFSGRSHTVSDSVIFNQALDFKIAPGADVIRQRIDWRR